MRYVTIGIPVAVWQSVDVTTGNTLAVDVVEGVMETVMIGECVRDAGWRAASSYAGALDEYGWPPPDHVLDIVLRQSHWMWVLNVLERWQPYETDGRPEQARQIIASALSPEG